MADEDGHEEKKDKEKDADLKRNLSSSRAKKSSKTIIPSKSSLKKGTLSDISGLSDISSTSTILKRPSSMDKMTKIPRYQNTYRLDSKKPFKAHEVYKILESIVLKEAWDYPNYDCFMAAKVVQAISSEVRNTVRQLSYDRYKICVLVYLGEKKFQGFHAVFRALWDHERDAWTTYYYECRTYFISCTCYGIYHD